MENKKHKNHLVWGLVALVALLMIIAVAGLLFLRPAPQVIQGEVEASQLRISGRLPGRVNRFMVSEGAHVEAGDTLVEIFSSLAEAQLARANAVQDAAAAEHMKVQAGTRSEVVASAREVWQQAQASLSVAQKSYDRMQALYDKGVVSAQKRDEAQAAYEVAQAAEAAARAQYEMAQRGARTEDRRASEAMLAAAAGGVAEVEALLEDQYLTAPRAGEVSEIFPLEGELVSLGAPIMNITLMDDMWVTFNVREELLQRFAMGSCVDATIPALGHRRVTLQVFHVKDMGSYAVWKATKAQGQYDAKTFAVKARPTEAVDGLRPGMTVLIEEER